MANATLKIGTFKYNLKKGAIVSDSKQYAIPRNIIDVEQFSGQFRILYWDAEFTALTAKIDNLNEQLNALAEKFNEGKYKGTHDEYREEYNGIMEDINIATALANKYGELITKSEYNVSACHRFVKACVYTVNANMRKKNGKPVYFGANGQGACSVIGDIANGRKSVRDGKKELVTYLESELFGDGTDTFVKGATIRLTDEQVNELVDAYKGILDKWGKKDIGKVRTLKAELNQQLILKCLKKTFKFATTADSYYC